MRIRVPAFLFTALLAVSCQRAPETTAPPAPQRIQVGNDADDHITVEAVDGRPLSPEEQRAFAAFGKQLLADAFSKILADGLAQMYQKLKISDDLERQLFNCPGDWGSPSEPGDTLGIYLVRPGDAPSPPETIELLADGKPVIRFTRVVAKVETPLAIMTRQRVAEGKLEQSEVVAVYDAKAGWRTSRPTVTKETLKLGKP